MTRAAKGILTIANLMMSSIIKKVSIARGYDPRDFALFCYGGGGPLHGIELARALNIPRVIVPPEPGNFSAIGMLLADPRLDTSQHRRGAPQPGEPRQGERRLCGARSRGPRGAAARIRRRRRSRSSAKPRCATRASTIRSRSRSSRVDDAATLRARFDQEYLRRYGHANAAAEVEIVVLHSLATLQMKRPDIGAPRDGRELCDVPRTVEVRPIFFLEEDRFLPTQIYDRYALEPG